MKNNLSSKSVGRNVLLGAAGGLTAAFTMNLFQAAFEKSKSKVLRSGGAKQKTSDVPATTVVAKKISKSMFHHRLTRVEGRAADPLVHYGFGVGVGAIYGLMCSYAPIVELFNGLAYGTAVWLIADETALPLLKISKGPKSYSIMNHVESLTSHLVYGAVLNSFLTKLEGRLDTLANRKPVVTKGKKSVSDKEGHYDIDGVSFNGEEVVVSSDALH